MRKLVVTEFVTLDGVMEDPGGAEKTRHGGWAFKYNRGPVGDKFKLDELFASDAMLLGRVTYQGFAAAWPNIKDDAGFADRMNSMKKHVVSTTLNKADWNNSTIIRRDIVNEISKLKEMPGKDILVAGSSTLVQTLAQNGLVDEYRLMVYPIVLGSGKRLFNEGLGQHAMHLVEAKPIGDGILTMVYQVDRA